jgi:hypothetical protein
MSIGFGAQLYRAGEEFLVRSALVLRAIHTIHQPLMHQSLSSYSRYTGEKPAPTAALDPGFRRESKRRPS